MSNLSLLPEVDRASFLKLEADLDLAKKVERLLELDVDVVELAFECKFGCNVDFGGIGSLGLKLCFDRVKRLKRFDMPVI